MAIHGRKADRRVHRVAPADPVPELEHVGRVDTELRYLSGVGGDGDKVPAHGFLVAEVAQAPRACGAGIGQRFEGREGFRADDEQRLSGIEVARGFRKVRAVHVRNEVEAQVALAVMTQRFVGHHGTEVGAADADIDDMANALAGTSPPLSAAHLIREGGHPLEHRVHAGDDVRGHPRQTACHPARAKRGEARPAFRSR